MKAPFAPAIPRFAPAVAFATLLLLAVSPASHLRADESAAPRFDLKGVASAAMRDSTAGPGTVPSLPADAPLGGLDEDIESAEMPALEESTSAIPDSPPGTPPGVDEAEDTATELEFVVRSNYILSRILENQRFLDPFGMTMDPSNTRELPIAAEGLDETEEAAPLNISSLKAALQKLPVTGVYPRRQVVVVGPRSFSPGDQLGLRAEGMTLRLRFEGIREYSIFFRDMETNEVTSVEFNARPDEFEPILPGSRREPGEGIHAMNGLFIAN